MSLARVASTLDRLAGSPYLYGRFVSVVGRKRPKLPVAARLAPSLGHDLAATLGTVPRSEEGSDALDSMRRLFSGPSPTRGVGRIRLHLCRGERRRDPDNRR